MRHDEQLWQQEARRLGGEAFVETIIELQNGLGAIAQKLDAMEKRHDTSEAAIALINRAFPAGDTDGHRRYHELIIENTAEKRRLRMAVQEKTISALIWAAIAGIGVAVWHEIINRMIGTK